MKRSLLMLTAVMLISIGTARAQHVTDVILSVPVTNGPIVTSGGSWTGQYAGRVFDDGIMTSVPPYTATSPGFDGIIGTFPSGSVIRLDFVKELLYWNGSALVPPAATMTVSYGGRSGSISATDTSGKPGFIVSSVTPDGSFHIHPTYALPNDAAAGLYGLVLTLGPATGTTGFTTSDSFLVTMARGTVPNYSTGLSTMVDAAFAPVPEPSAAVLVAVAAGGGWLALRTTRKTRR
ncbi:MAG: hypothetical protein ACKOEM_02990 [Planctomycetia bacterium]